ncbi:hypothetical protein Tco_0487998 [Tanacetum coccineum]
MQVYEVYAPEMIAMDFQTLRVDNPHTTSEPSHTSDFILEEIEGRILGCIRGSPDMILTFADPEEDISWLVQCLLCCQEGGDNLVGANEENELIPKYAISYGVESVYGLIRS